MSDTPESVKELISGYCGYRGAIDWGPMIDMLTRYADLLSKTCEWRRRPLTPDWMPSCVALRQHEFERSPTAWGFKTCPYCGGRIVEVKG